MTGKAARKNVVTPMRRYPDRSFERAALAAGATVKMLWMTQGAEAGPVAWLACYSVAAGLCIVQTYKGGSWDVYTTSTPADDRDKIVDALTRCKVAAIA